MDAKDESRGGLDRSWIGKDVEAVSAIGCRKLQYLGQIMCDVRYELMRLIFENRINGKRKEAERLPPESTALAEVFVAGYIT